MRNVKLLVVVAVLLVVGASSAWAQGGTLSAKLKGYEEVPATANPNSATFQATISEDNSSIEYTMTYNVPEGNVTQSHLHFGQRGVNGGIQIFLCSNLGNGPAGTQACPTHSGTITGTITADNVLAVSGQSANANDLVSVIKQIKAGVMYANIHTDQLPGGSIRAQVAFTAAP
jgi:CHRD domain-containing protein